MREPVVMFRRHGTGVAAPGVVRGAVYALLLWVALAIVAALVGPRNVSAPYRLGYQVGGVAVALAVLALARQVSFGRHWARVTAWLLLAVSVVGGSRIAVSGATVDTLAGAAQGALAAVPMLLLVAPSARSYFRPNSIPAKPVPLRRPRSTGTALLALAVLAAVGCVWGIQSPLSRSIPSADPLADLASPATFGTAPGRVYRLTAAHFAARFSRMPSEESGQGRVDGYTKTIYLARDLDTGAYVETADFTPALPGADAQDIRDVLAGSLHEVATRGNWSVRSTVLTRFRGRSAALGEYKTSTGTAMTAVVAIWSQRRIYLLVAPSGQRFADLARSFVALP